jgi:hypothetical protein
MMDPVSPWAYAPASIAAFAAGVAAVIGAVNKRDIGTVRKELVSVKHTGEATHTLSNSAMGAQLQVNVATLEALSVVLHRVAVTSKEEADAAAALAVDVRVDAAKKVLQDHLTKQAVVDSKVKEKA